MNSPRVVVTGLGAVSPLGLTAGEMWANLCEGQCGAGPITAFDPVGLPCIQLFQDPGDLAMENASFTCAQVVVHVLLKEDMGKSIARENVLTNFGLLTCLHQPVAFL